MQKDFDTWNSHKKNVHTKSQNRFYKPRDIWWCSLGVNVGFEEDGRGEKYQRPVLVVKSFSKHTCLVVPLTTSAQIHKYRVDIGRVGDRNAHAILSQIKIVDTKRFVERISVLSGDKFEHIRKTIRDML